MLKTAIEAAKKGGELATKYFYNLPKVEWKKDASPVTEADRETEKVIRKIISRDYPDHGIHGEELEDKKSASPYRWIIDPIDGTRDYVKGIPFWAVYIAVLKENQPIIGVIYMPMDGDLITAEKGRGTFLNGKRVHVSKVKKLSDVYISHGQVKRFINMNKINQLENLCLKIMAARSYGNFAFKMLVQGNLDAILEAHGALHDFAATKIVVEEAGGKFSDFTGKDSMTSGNAVWSNGLVHDSIVKLIK